MNRKYLKFLLVVCFFYTSHSLAAEYYPPVPQLESSQCNQTVIVKPVLPIAAIDSILSISLKAKKLSSSDQKKFKKTTRQRLNQAIFDGNLYKAAYNSQLLSELEND